MTPFDSAAFNRLAKRIAEKDHTETGHVRSGAAADHANYQGRCGYLRALDDVSAWMKDIESELRQGK